MSLIRSIYHAVLPESLRIKIYYRKNNKRNTKLLQDITGFLDSPKNHFPTEDSQEISQFLKNNGLHVFPYEFSKKYSPEQITVFQDKKSGLHYVNFCKKKLYFKRAWDAEMIKNKFSFLLNEQDAESPHQYLSEDFKIKDNAIIIDAGAAEGIFILPFLDKIKHAYLFETDEEWIEALHATFAEHKEKVTIINKYISEKDDEMNVQLDTFFNNKKVDLIKIDVDGAELNLLKGASKMLSRTESLMVAICTYHNQNDEEDFDHLLKDYGFKTTTSAKYMLFHYDDNLKAPYLRRGIIRAQK